MMTGPVKIIFIIADLEGGGAQRMVINLLSRIDRGKFTPLLVLSKKKGAYLDEIPGDIPIRELGREGMWDLPALVVRLARIISEEKPKIVFSALIHGNILALAAERICRWPYKAVISEHISQKGYRYSRRRLLADLARRIFYPSAHLIVAVSRGVKGDLAKVARIPPDTIKVIYDPVDLDKIEKLSTEPVAGDIFGGLPTVIGAGRLVRQKGFEYLLQAFSIAKKEVPSRLLIIGDGEERGRLESLAKHLGIEKDVSFLGFQKNPYKYLTKAEIFVSSSMYEGFCYAIPEAMAVGTAVIATDCPHGPAEILRDGEDGLLVSVADVKAMAEAIIRLFRNKCLRTSLSAAGRRRVMEFSVDRITREYEEIFLTQAE
jgi:glycosyltransferase involved in cell wall biosynthesis